LNCLVAPLKINVGSLIVTLMIVAVASASVSTAAPPDPSPTMSGNDEAQPVATKVAELDAGKAHFGRRLQPRRTASGGEDAEHTYRVCLHSETNGLQGVDYRSG
jgi:hypothetical protein